MYFLIYGPCASSLHPPLEFGSVRLHDLTDKCVYSASCSMDFLDCFVKIHTSSLLELMTLCPYQSFLILSFCVFVKILGLT